MFGLFSLFYYMSTTNYIHHAFQVHIKCEPKFRQLLTCSNGLAIILTLDQQYAGQKRGLIFL